MKTFQKYNLLFFIIVGTASMFAMDRQEPQVKPEMYTQRQARCKKRSDKNLTSLVIESSLCASNVIKMLGGYIRPSLVFSGDGEFIPLIIAEQRDAIVQAVGRNDCEGLKNACRLLNVYRSLFLLPKALKTSDFIKNYQNEDGETLVRIGIGRDKNEQVVKLLLDCGVNIDTPDKHGLTPLHTIIVFGSTIDIKTDIAKFLLDHGANIDFANNDGDTELHRSASYYENQDIAKFLLDHGANIHAINNNGDTPLHSAAQSYGCEGAVKLLLEHGADIHAVNNEGDTALHLSVLDGIVDTAKLLLDCGADLDIRNNKGKLAEDMATDQKIKVLIAQEKIKRDQKTSEN